MNASASLPEKPWDPTTWSAVHFLAYWALHLVAVEVLQHGIVMNFGWATSKRIPVGGRHLDVLQAKDKAFIVFNRLCTPILTMSLLYFCWTRPDHVEWDPAKLSVWNTLGSLVGFFAIYDFIYVGFHGLLHVPAFYPWVHKHHHQQHAPSRGNVDAVNVHPFEFFSGEMLHVLCVALVPCHVYTVVAFVAIGGILASLNHTRFDISFLGIYDVKAHDMHHRLPRTCVGSLLPPPLSTLAR